MNQVAEATLAWAVERGQLRLFPAPQPLVERLGADFFRTVPEAPGIYRMYDAVGRLIYVGKAGNLRKRLNSYRRTAGSSRKTRRLIHEARRIEWDICETERVACVRENEWIRTHRPRFNRAGVWPKSARFVVVVETPGGFQLEVKAEPCGESFGAFRGGVGRVLVSMARLFWFAMRRSCDPGGVPHAWSAAESLRTLEISDPDARGWLPAVREYFGGWSDALVARWVGEIPEPTGGFAIAYLAREFEVVESFYRRGPRMNSELIGTVSDAGNVAPEGTAMVGATKTLSAEERDDRLALRGRREVAPPFRPEAGEALTGGSLGVGDARRNPGTLRRDGRHDHAELL